MSKAFMVIYETPFGTVRAEADTQRELADLVHDRIVRMLIPVSNLNGMSLDDAASAVLETYRSVSWGRRQARKATRLYREDGERDAIRCYLKGLTIAQSVESLTSRKDVAVSKSALGRFFRTLYELGVRPLKAERNRTAVNRHIVTGDRGREAR